MFPAIHHLRFQIPAQQFNIQKSSVSNIIHNMDRFHLDTRLSNIYTAPSPWWQVSPRVYNMLSMRFLFAIK